MNLPFALLAGVLILGCTGGSTTPATTPTTEPAGATMDVTEPWKSLNLPIDGAIVDLSNDVSLKLTYPTHTQETAGGIVAVLSDAMTAAGFTKGSDKSAPSARKVTFTKGEQTISLTLDKRADPPSVKFTQR